MKGAQQKNATERNTSQRSNTALETLRIKLEVLEKERDRERAQLEETITDLREDRDKWRQQATALLEGKQPKGFFKKIMGR